MNRFKHLRLRIADLASSTNLKDDYAIEGICQLLNIKYPLEEPKEQPKTIYMLFGKTEQEILIALDFYDKHSKQIVQNDLTLSEAVEKAYAIQKEYAFGGIDKKWIEVQLKSYEAIGLIKFKEDFNIERSHTIYRSYNKVIVISETVIKRVAQKLRQKCTEVFGTTWNNENAEEFAKTAIEEYERLVNK